MMMMMMMMMMMISSGHLKQFMLLYRLSCAISTPLIFVDLKPAGLLCSEMLMELYLCIIHPQETMQETQSCYTTILSHKQDSATKTVLCLLTKSSLPIRMLDILLGCVCQISYILLFLLKITMVRFSYLRVI
jgi:hypothetical protein